MKLNEGLIPITIPTNNSLKSFNFYIYKAENTCMLIDAGMDDDMCWNGLLDSLHQHHLSLSDLTEILVTHHHIDHIGLINRITAQQNIPVYAHSLAIPRLKRDADYLERRIHFFEDLYNEMGCGSAGVNHIKFLKTALLKNAENAIKAEVIPFNINTSHHVFELLEVPGHAPDQTAFYDSKRKWLFAGDLLINHISSNAIIEPDSTWQRLPTLSQHMASLKKCLSMPIDVVYSGHGAQINNPEKLIITRLHGVEEKAKRLLKLIDNGFRTANDLAQEYYQKRYTDQFPLVMSEIIGHLDYLEVTKRVQKLDKQGVWHYFSS